MGLPMSLRTFIYLSIVLFFFQLTYIFGQPICHEKERSALLQFKDNMSIDESATNDPSGYPKVESWNVEENGDCCSWDGVKCNETSGYVIELDLSSSWLYGSIDSTSTLFNLVHLQWLSLAYNDFHGSQIPSKINNLSNLSHLNLSQSLFSDQIPSEILQLSKLELLDLSGGILLQLQQPGLESLVEKLPNLKVLNLDSVIIDSPLPHLLTNLSSLTFLSLSSCSLEGLLIPSLGSLKNLIHLDLSANNFWGLIVPSLGNLNNLIHLDLSDNNFSGMNLSILTNFTHLNYLGLSFNDFSIQSSSLSWIGMHTKLTHLSFSGINLTGEIPYWLVNLTHLTHLRMRGNQFIGQIPFWLFNLKQLSTLDFSYNKLSGQIPSQINNLTQLKVLDLSSNQLQGSIPSSIFELKNLEDLLLSSNNLSGSMELGLFLQLKSLKVLDLSSNHLSLLTNSTVNTPLPQFDSLSLRSCNLRGFPDFLPNQDPLYELDLSSNKISGLVPGWLFNISTNINLSHNLLIGFELFDQQPSVDRWPRELDFSFNKLQGLLPILPRSAIEWFLASNNKLSGEIAPFICKLDYLTSLDLSHNSFSGKLPRCLSNFSSDLLLLNLQNNKFRGSIPEIFMKATYLRLIDLSNNLLHGKIPRSLANCTKLEFFDLENNKINDIFPSWIGTLPNLEVLNLKSNKLYGVVEEPKSNFEFPKLRIIDLSHNRFIGRFPSKYFECWNSMKVVNETQLTYMTDGYMMNGVDWSEFYTYSLIMVNKGIQIEYLKISNMLVSISLSNNRFEGDILASISILKGLRYLDLSNNNLTGVIPSSMSNLTVLESLDLSNNNLSGEIPQQLVTITFLEYFDVSYNNLTGPIPLGAQFNTFNSSSYEGNPGLCGAPLLNKCGNSELPPNKDDQNEPKSSLAFGWKEVAIGYASGIIIGMALGHVFCTKKYEWFVKIFGMPLRSMKKMRGQRRN